MLPFQALMGVEVAQQALLLLAVEPRLRGVVLAAGAGTGKSSLARGLRRLIADERVPFVEIPTSVDVENLLGGLDLEATLLTGEMRLRAGVLAKADGGIAYVDGLNLLTDSSANLLMSVLDEGAVRVEREGVSLREPANFSLIGTYDPAEGTPRRHLLDRVGLLVTLPSEMDVGVRTAVIHSNLRPTDQANWREDEEFLQGLIRGAQDHLPSVHISEAQLRQLAATALAYGVEGHRVDLFAARAACAAAALELRDEVEDEDLALAVRLVILPRATQIPTAPPQEQAPPPPPPPEMAEGEGEEEQEPETADSDSEQNDDGEATAPPELVGPQPEQILEALESRLPEDLAQLPFTHVQRGRAGSRGSTTGNRGRHLRSVPGDPRRARIDIIGTLRAAAPWQRLRNKDAEEARLALQLSDVRVKQYRSKAGALFCFGVDASGSMALHRMRQAKGAVHALLGQAYVNRDRVALIAFRGERAELLMPPTQSVELAKNALDLLPTGGGTPLASALLLADEVAEQAKQKGIMQTVLVLLTDGRGNVPLKEGEDAEEELRKIGRYLVESSLQIIVVDTQRDYLSRGEARKLAEWVGGEYAYLPNAGGEEIAGLAAAAVRG